MGLNILTQYPWHCFQAQQCLGYCPQFDALDLLITGRQTLEFYAHLRGTSNLKLLDSVHAPYVVYGVKHIDPVL